MHKWRSRAVPLFVSVIFTTILNIHAQTRMEPIHEPITLRGTIKLIHGFGPPGYGEDKARDAKVSYLALVLPKAINIPCTPENEKWRNIDCASATRLKLFFNGPYVVFEKKAKDLKGKYVSVTGKLERQDTAGEMTPIYMEVSSIAP